MMEIANSIKETIRSQMDFSHATSDETLMNWIEQSVFQYSQHERYVTVEQKQQLVQMIFHAFRGLDVLQPLIDDPTITEIMINRHDEIFIERNGNLALSDLSFESEEKLNDIIQAIVAKVNRVVNESSPIVDARLKDGSRVNVVLPPIALKGPAVTIRKFPAQPLSIKDLIAKGAMSEEAADFLTMLIKAKYNIFIGGGTGSGKTTLLNAMANMIPDDERIITIEDAAELQLRSIPNLISLETRNANTEGKGEVAIRQLIKSALRMRPNRIIVGEVRGAEALDMLQAMNTGHDGSLSTGHANSTTDMLSRLETMVLSGASLPIEVIRKQICSAIDIMVHVSRLRDRSRKVVEISEIVGLRHGEIELNPLYEFQDTALMKTNNSLHQTHKLKLAGIFE